MLKQGNTLARYEILHGLGRGAIGAVYAARDRSTGVVVALKTLDLALLNKPDANSAELFLKGARSAGRLRHRNIVKIHDVGAAGGTAYIAMEMLEGESLRNLLDHGPLPIARAIRIAHDIACGLAYAHLEGVVHGGVKPSNMIVLRSGVVKITDFGIGQLGEAALLPGPRAGYLSYASPEQLRGDPVDHRCDLFSLGALFYEMLTHRPPFEGGSPKEIMENIRHAEPPPPSELNPHVPRALDGIVFSMLAKHPDDRLPGAPIVLRDLQRLEEGLGLASGASAGVDEPIASVPPAEPEPKLRTPAANQSGIREVMREAGRFRPRGQTEPVARQPAPEPGLRTPAPNRLQDRAPFPDGEPFDYHKAMLRMDRSSEGERSSGSRPTIFAALALVLAVLAIGLTAFMYYSSGPSERRIAASRMQVAPASAPAASDPTALAPVAEAPQEPATAPTAPAAPEASPPRAVGDARAEQESLGIAPTPMPSNPPAAEPSPSAEAQSSVAHGSEQPAAAGTAPAQQVPQAAQSTASVPEQQPGGTAKLIIAVSPQGEIYIDGKHYGTTPPITTLDLTPGMHRIEVRSGSRKSYLTYMTVQAGDVRRIRYDFGAKPIRPPG